MIARLALTASILVIAVSGFPSAQQSGASAPAATQQQPSQGTQDMMKMHEQMMAEMQAATAKLDALVKDMNAATGNAKVDAIAAVVNELVRQHKAMQEHMGQMMGGRGTTMKK